MSRADVLTREELPDFRSAAELRKRATAALRPPTKISVSQCAQEHRRLNTPGGYTGRWHNELTPFLVAPMDAGSATETSVVALLGPSQFGKTEVILNVLGHTAKYNPGDILVLQPTRVLAQDFSERRIVRLFKHSPDIRDELGDERSDDKTFQKVFVNGSMVSIAWPTVSQLSSRPVPLVIIDERDRMPDDIGGEGDPVELGLARTKTYRNGYVLVVCSPSRSNKTGIVAIFNSGSAELWFVKCKHCGEYWSPGFDRDKRTPTLDHLQLPDDDGLTMEQRAAGAELSCDRCGGLHSEQDKAALNAGGVYVGAGQTIAADGAVTGELVTRRRRTFWFHGLMSPFARLTDIANTRLVAENYFEETGDESKLKTFYNTDLGVPYISQAAGRALVSEEIEGRAEGYKLQEVPTGVRFLTASVDIQGDRFEVMVMGWGERAEGWVIDRFAIRQLDDGRTDIKPAIFEEHWHELIPRVFNRVYPFANDPTKGLRPAVVSIDTGGAKGTTQNAYQFYRHARKARVPMRSIMLVKGANNKRAAALGLPSHERDQNGDKVAGGARFFVLGVHELKATVVNRLRRNLPGPGFIHTPVDLERRYYEEWVAERLEGDEWVRHGPNETLDLTGYNIAAYLRIRPHRIDFDKALPDFAKPEVIIDPDATADEDESEGESAEPVIAKTRQRAPQRGRMSMRHARRSEWGD